MWGLHESVDWDITIETTIYGNQTFIQTQNCLNEGRDPFLSKSRAILLVVTHLTLFVDQNL